MPGICAGIRGPWCRENQEAWRTSLGRGSGDKGSGVRGRVWKTSLDGDGDPEEGGLGCFGALEAKGLRERRSARLLDPSPSQTCGPLDRHVSLGRWWGRGKGGCGLWGLGAWGL